MLLSRGTNFFSKRADWQVNLMAMTCLLACLLFRFQLPWLALFCLVPIFYFCDKNKKGAVFLFWGMFSGCLFAFFEQYYLAKISTSLYIGASIGYGLFYLTPLFIGLFFLKRFFPSNFDFFIPGAIVLAFLFFNFGFFPIVPFSFFDGWAYRPAMLGGLKLMGWYGFIFLLAVGNFIIFRILTRKRRDRLFSKLEYSTLLFTLALFIFFSGNYFNKEKNAKVDQQREVVFSLIQGGFWGETVNDEVITKKMLFLSGQAIESLERQRRKPDLIIWSENNHSEVFFKEDSEGDLVAFPETSLDEAVSFVEKNDIPILISSFVETFANPEEFYNAAILIEPGKKIEQFYYKQRLVFWGEAFPSWLNFWKDYRESFGWGRSIVSGEGKGNGIFQLNGFRFGALICFESGFSGLSRKLKAAQADFIVNLSNDAFFESERELKYQETASVFRAAENQVPFLRATNVGFTEIINQKGQIISRLNSYEEGFLNGKINF